MTTLTKSAITGEFGTLDGSITRLTGFSSMATQTGILELQEVVGFIPVSLGKLQMTKFKVHSRASAPLITNAFNHFTFVQL